MFSLFIALLLSVTGYAAGVPEAVKSSDFLENAGLTTTVSGNAITIRLKTATGSDPSAGSPVRAAFRSATASSGTFLVRSITSARSTVISSGSTAGCTSAVECLIYVYALDNAGAVELAWSKTYFLDDLQTTVAEGGAGAADSATTLYSTTARTSKAIRMLGILYVTEATAGTWVTLPSKIRLTNQKVDQTRTESAIVSSGGVVTELNNSDWLNGNCGVGGGAVFTCSFNAGMWGSAPVCTFGQFAGLLNGINITILNTATLQYQTAQSGAIAQTQVNFTCTGSRP